jgi:hypothetical protein
MSLVDNNLEHFLEQQNKRRAERLEQETTKSVALEKLIALGLTPDDLKALGLGGN